MSTYYRVSIGTGLAWTYAELVQAETEQEAVDKLADKLTAEDSGFVQGFYELVDLTEDDETVDEYADKHGLVCCGNTNVYLELVGIEKVSFDFRGVECSFDIEANEDAFRIDIYKDSDKPYTDGFNQPYVYRCELNTKAPEEVTLMRWFLDREASEPAQELNSDEAEYIKKFALHAFNPNKYERVYNV